MLRVLKVRGDDALSQVVTLDNGWIEIRGAVIAKAGVLEYQRGDGETVRELRDPEVMHTPEALASYEGRPVLLHDHPTDERGLVTLLDSKNSERIARHGALHNVRASTAYDPDLDAEVPVTRADVLLETATAIQAARNGVRGWSVGYGTDTDATPGDWNGERYDVRQTDDKGNHLVLTANPRAGRITEFRFDTADAVTTGAVTKGDATMEDEKKDKKPAEGMDERLDAILARLDEMGAAQKDLEKRMDAYDDPDKDKGDMDDDEEGKGDMEAMDDEEETTAKGDTLAGDLLDAVDQARRHVGADYSPKGKTLAAVRGDTVKAITGEDVRGQSSAYIAGAYNAALKTVNLNAKAAAATRGDASNSKANNPTALTGKAKAAAWYQGARD